MRNHRNNKRRLPVMPIVLTVVALVLMAIMGVYLVAGCLEFDETGAHVVDVYGVLDPNEIQLIDYSQNVKDEPEADELSAQPTAEPETAIVTETEPAQTETYTLYTETAEPIRAVVVEPRDLTYDTDYQNQIIRLALGGVINAVVVDLKDENGSLMMPTETSVVSDYNVRTEYSDYFPMAVQTIKESGVRIIGCINCFADRMATAHNEQIACVSASGARWTDADGMTWIDPTDAMGVQYLCDIARAGVELGCDEIMLRGLCFPQGDLTQIALDDPQDSAAVIQADFDAIAQAAGVPMSLCVDSGSGGQSENGVDLQAMYKKICRLFVPLQMGAESEADVQGMLQVLASATGTRGDKLTPIYTTRESWLETSNTAVYDMNGDIYQMFYLGD